MNSMQLLILLFTLFFNKISSLYVFNHPVCLKIKCHGDKIILYRFSSCPAAAFEGDGSRYISFRRCGSGSCMKGVQCVDGQGITTEHGQCGNSPPPSCPPGSTGDGIKCSDIDECEILQPCFSKEACHNLSPGFRCDPCPRGYSGDAIQGVRMDLNHRQVGFSYVPSFSPFQWYPFLLDLPRH